MNLFKRTAVAAALALSVFNPAAAQWQVPNHATPTGRGSAATGFNFVGPCAAGVPIAGNGAAADPSCQGVSNAGIAPGPANTIKGTLNGSATVDLAVPNCTVLQYAAGSGFSCGTPTTAFPVVASRAIATTLNLSAFSTVTTQGYAAGGDGGGATFKNIGGAPFSDQQILTGTITNNGVSGCTSVSPGVALTGGTGRGAAANVGVVSGVITNVQLVNNHGNGYTVGDTLSISVAGCSQVPKFTITALTTPTASFTDAGGNNFQYVVDAGNYANVRQFGAACNYTTTLGDAGSTNDTTAIQNALNWAGDTVAPTIDAGGVAGRVVRLPFGNCLSGALFVPYGTTFSGQNAWSSQLKFLDALSATAIPITICEPTTQLSCFGSQVTDMTLRGGSGTANSNIPMVFSNNLQQMNMLLRVAMYPGQRGCVEYGPGYGGAAQVGFMQVECTMSSTGNPGFNFVGLGTTLVYLKNVDAEFGGSGVSANGIQASGGFIDIDNTHCEGVSTCVMWNNTGGTGAGALRVHNISGGASCINLIVKQSGSTASDVVVGMATPNGCTNTVNNGGTITGGVLVADVLF